MHIHGVVDVLMRDVVPSNSQRLLDLFLIDRDRVSHKHTDFTMAAVCDLLLTLRLYNDT